MIATTQKTYKGKSAGQWLRRATTAKMRAGTVEIVTDDLPGCILLLSDDDNLVIARDDGCQAVLECGMRAISKMQHLGATAERAMLEANHA